MKIIFITTWDIFDECGNGGCKGSKKNYDLLCRKFGEENIIVIHMVLPTYVNYGKNSANIIQYNQPNGNIQSLLCCLFMCKMHHFYDETKIMKKIKELQPDVVFLDGSIEGKLLKRAAPYVQICFFHNIEADYAFNKVKNAGFFYIPSWIAAKFNERQAIKYANYIGSLNHRDSSILLNRYKRSTDFFIPVSFSDQFNEKKVKPNDTSRILFIGSYFGPNVDSLDWFVFNVMTKLPDISLDIVGRNFEKKKKDYSSYPNINVIGTVNNTSEYYYNHTVVVMPILYGAGMKVKTAEAMMYGRTIVASDEALEGYEVEGVKGIYRCNTVNEWIETLTLLCQKNNSVKYQPEVRALFLEKYETSKVGKELYRILDQIKKNHE